MSEHTVELKWLILNSSRVKFPLVRMSANCFFGVDVLDLDFGVQISSIEQPVKRNSVSPGNVSHCGTPPFNDHLDLCFVVFKHIQQSFLMRRLDVLMGTQSILFNTLIFP